MAVRSPFRVIQLVLPANKFHEFVIFGKKKQTIICLYYKVKIHLISSII